MLLEVFKRVFQQRGEGPALNVVGQMQQGQVIELDAALALTAARLGADSKLPLAGSVILATARHHRAELWTQDADFDGFPNVHYRPKQRARR